MDLQWQRQVELWLQLIGAAEKAADANMVFMLGQYTCYFECHYQRACLTLSHSVPDYQCDVLLLRLLNFLQPQAAEGIPLRTWLADNRIWLSATAPPQSDAELWAKLTGRQRRLLDCVTESLYR